MKKIYIPDHFGNTNAEKWSGKLTFFEKYNISPKTATDFYYQFSQATNYIRTDRIAKDEKWAADTEFSDFWTAYKKRTISHL